MDQEERQVVGAGPEQQRIAEITSGTNLHRDEINRIMGWALGLPVIVKFELYETLRTDLSEALSENNPDGEVIARRRVALNVMREVCQHLGFGEDELPTIRQFDQAVNDLDLDAWNSGKVIRLWGSWRLAKSAYSGTWSLHTPASEKLRKRYAHQSLGNISQRLDGIQTWLEAKPEEETKVSYERWVEQHNQSFQGKERTYTTAESLSRTFPVGWKNTLAVARGEMSIDEAWVHSLSRLLPKRDKSKALIGLTAISKVLHRSANHVKRLPKSDPNFPTPVALVHGQKAWLYQDIKLYGRELAAPRRSEGEMQAEIMDAVELGARLLLMTSSFETAIQRKRWDLIPEPEGAISVGLWYWRRERVETWISANAALMSGRQKRNKRSASESEKDLFSDPDPEPS